MSTSHDAADFARLPLQPPTAQSILDLPVRRDLLGVFQAPSTDAIAPVCLPLLGLRPLAFVAPLRLRVRPTNRGFLLGRLPRVPLALLAVIDASSARSAVAFRAWRHRSQSCTSGRTTDEREA
jgi:hypothetical protein